MAMSTDKITEKFRLDKWLCAARFFKTRNLAADAVECGHVHVNQMRVKPARALAPGDVLDIRIGQKQYTVEVRGLSNIRGSASVSQNLYSETEDSLKRRESIAARLKAEPQPLRFRGRADQT